MKNKAIKLITTLLLSVMTLNYIGTTVFAVKYTDEMGKMGISSSLEIATGTTPTPIETTPPSDTSGSSSSSGSNGPTAKTAEAQQELSYLEEASKSFTENGLGTIADGIVGIATITLRVQTILIGFAAQSLATLAGTSAGSLDDKVMVISPDQILFNRLAITDINFFQTDSFGSGNKKALASNSPVKAIRENIAKWYYALRTIALIILLIILIYIGIRMAMSTVASEKAVYKQWLWNWLVSMALIFVLHYFILIVINVNNAFVDMLYEGVKQNTALNSSGGYTMDSYVEGLIGNSFASTLSGTSAWSFTLVYFGIALLTLVFLIMYIMRMIRIAFLILIAPIITITYSIDKLKDNAAQALNAWVRQFCEAVLIQPFHCIIYLAFISTAMSCLTRFGTLAAGMLTILFMWFIFTAEKMVKEIFGIKTDASGNGFATAAVVTGLMSKAGSVMSKGKKVASNVKDIGKNDSSKLAPITSNSGKASNVAQQNMNNVNANAGAASESKNTSGNNVPIYAANGNVISTVEQNPNVNQNLGSSLNNTNSSLNTSGNSVLIYGANGNAISAVEQNPNVSNDPIQNALNNAHNTKNGSSEMPLSRTAQMATNHTRDIDSLRDASPEMNAHSNEQNEQQKQSMKDKVISGIKAAPGKAYKLYNKTQVGNFGTAMGITAAMATGMAGKSGGEIVAAGIAGKTLGNNLADTAAEYRDEGIVKANEYKNKLDTYMADRKIKNSERELATAYNNYKETGNYSHNQMGAISRSMSQMSDQEIGNIKNENAKAYARALKAMPNIYAEGGKDDPNQELADTIKKIQNGQIKPKENEGSMFGFLNSSQDKKRRKVERFRENEQKMNEQRTTEYKGNEKPKR